jgi:hypothetical protein
LALNQKIVESMETAKENMKELKLLVANECLQFQRKILLNIKCPGRRADCHPFRSSWEAKKLWLF